MKTSKKYVCHTRNCRAYSACCCKKICAKTIILWLPGIWTTLLDNLVILGLFLNTEISGMRSENADLGHAYTKLHSVTVADQGDGSNLTRKNRTESAYRTCHLPFSLSIMHCIYLSIIVHITWKLERFITPAWNKKIHPHQILKFRVHIFANQGQIRHTGVDHQYTLAYQISPGSVYSVVLR